MTTRDLTGYRVVAVHAHPDDEALFTGGTLADLSARGAEVTVITITLGEEGEIIGDAYQQLAESGQLGGFRAAELHQALCALGVDGIHLGGPGFFRDSGMAGSDSYVRPTAQVNRIPEVASHLREAFARLRPHAVITYGPDGGYGHPDHIAAHQAAHLALEGTDTRIWWAIYEREATYAALATIAEPDGWSRPDRAYLDNFTNLGADAVHQLSDAAFAAKRAALAAHPTQIWLADGTTSAVNRVPAWAVCNAPDVAPLAYALSNLLVMPVTRAEYFQLGAGDAPADGTLLGGLSRD